MNFQVINLTPFAAERFVVTNPQGAETLLVVVKGTYDLNKIPMAPAAPQDPVAMADLHSGEPDKSSLLVPADLTLSKPATDVLLQGSAYGGGREHVDVTLRMGPINKTLRVSGERLWQSFLGMASVPKPQPFDKIPLVYERAFGGTDESNPDGPPEMSPFNPAGVGFRGRKSKAEVIGTAVANIEYPNALITRPGAKPAPAGFGPIPAGWEPRSKLAGTYDQKWLDEVSPLLPDDVDPRFYQCAPADQVYPGYLQGGEQVEVLGATPSGMLRFSVPKGKPEIIARIGDADVNMPAICDTLIVNTDTMRLTLVWRASHVIHGHVMDVQWIGVEPLGVPAHA